MFDLLDSSFYGQNNEEPEAEVAVTLRKYLPVDKSYCLTLMKAPQFSELLVTPYFKTAVRTSDFPVAGSLSRGENKNEGLVYSSCDWMTHFSSVAEDRRRFK
jgi:hypothetical protein